MPGFKDKFKERFKAKFPKVNLTATRLDSILDKLDAKTDNEDDIDSQLDALNELMPFADIAKQDDRIRDLEAKTKTPKKPEATPENKDDESGDENPLVKSLMEKLNGIEQQLSAINGEKITGSRKEKLSEKLKDAPESYKNKILKDFGRMKFESDEEFEEYLTESENDLAAFVQEQSNSGLGKDRPFANSSKGANQEASKEEIEAIVDNIM